MRGFSSVARGAEGDLVLEDDRDSAREDQQCDEEDRGGGGAPFQPRSLQNRHFWFTPIASASSRELIVRPRDWACALSMKKRTRPSAMVN